VFPEPHSALPLPLRPSIERYKKIAKDLVRACRSGEPEAIRAWAEAWVRSLVELSEMSISAHLPVNVDAWIDGVGAFADRKLRNGTTGERTCRLADAQFVVARSHGFESWPKFAKHLDALAHGSSRAGRFEAAADAIVNGDITTLSRLLRDDPALIRARSTREHGATLLHYVAANGVEGYRQKTPQNIVQISEALLRAGAEVDAEANVYGGGSTTLGLTGTSVHPERAGVQNALMRTLLDHGAEIDRAGSGGGRQSLVAACLANGRPGAAEFLAENGARIGFAEAAGLGLLDVVASFFQQDDGAQAPPTSRQVNEAFLFACSYGRVPVIAILLERGADLSAHTRDGQTGLHCAVIGGHLDVVELLLQHRAPLEVENAYGGTPLGQAHWSAAHGGDADRYAAIVEVLTAAGARAR
jgi:ankyrin repeat protein